MKRFFITTIILGVILLGVFTVYAVQNYGAEGAQSDSNLSLEKMLTYAVQDEYLARAEYYAIMSKYGNVRPFSNIVNAEETHVNWLLPLFQEYGYSVPVDNAKADVVLPGDMKKALEVGVQAEIDNIAMYDKFLKEDLPADVKVVFEELKRGSENHLRAFQNNLRRY